jgi:CRISPR-associated protein (TIGR02584 family)
LAVMRPKAAQADSRCRVVAGSEAPHKTISSPPMDVSPDPGVGEPHTFPRRVLLAVTGLSPQVVTETVYALTQTLKPAFVPTEIHLMTTAEGAERARLTLLSKEPGWFHRLRRDYNLPEIKFDERFVHVLKAADGTPIVDIRTGAENTCVADSLTDKIRELTTDPNCAVHVSIAGGRKTMGFYAGYALSLLGRPQDRLSHVLVQAPYESNQQFYYPTPYPHVIFTHPPENRPLDAREAEVALADIPFVRLRGGLDERLLKGTATFSKVVAAAQRALDPLRLEIDLDGKCIHAGGQQVRLPPAELAFLSWLASCAKEGRPDVQCPPDGAPDRQYAEEYLCQYAHLGDDLDSATANRLRKEKGMDKTFFEQTKSKLRRKLKEALGPEGMRRYGIVDDGNRPKRYRIAVPAENIRWLGQAPAPDGKLAKSSLPGEPA